MWLEGLCQLKNPMTSMGIKAKTFQLVCSIVPQSIMLLHASILILVIKIILKNSG
jgi:hypothetical protein